MRTMIDPTKAFHTKALALLIIVALVAAFVGCEAAVMYSLKIEGTAGGEVTVPGEDTFEYDAGTVAELEAVADVGHRFVEWTGDVGTIAKADASSTTITMNGDYSITANFEEEEPVLFVCPNLEAAIREAIERPTGDIYPSDLKGLTELDADDRRIGDLTGLEHCTSLTHLNLDYNRITDIWPLAGLTDLQDLRLGSNEISDVSPLAGLINVGLLNFTNNDISDISPLASLTNLTDLSLMSNQISDVSPLGGLTNLTQLNLRDNWISDISHLEGLTKLTWLSIINSQISDISPLGGLTNLERLFLHENRISDVKPLQGLTKLEWLGIGLNEISDISPLADLTSLTFLSLVGNQIKDVGPLVENPGLGEGDEVRLDNNPLSEQSINEYIPALEARGVEVRY